MAIEDMDQAGQATRSRELAESIVAVVEAHWPDSVLVSTVVAAVCQRQSVVESEVGYGLSYARITGMVDLDPIRYTLTTQPQRVDGRIVILVVGGVLILAVGIMGVVLSICWAAGQ